MVNIDEINESISKFGAVVDGLSKLDDTYAKVDETNASAKKAVEEAQETLVKQTALNSEIISKMGEMELSINRKLDDVSSSMRDMVNTSEVTLKSAVDGAENNINKIITESSSLLEKKMDSIIDELSMIKNRQIISIIGIAVAIILSIVGILL